MIRPPSLIKPYDAFFSLDPAVIPLPSELPKDATDEQKKEREKQVAERARLIQLARDSGRVEHWAEITVKGETLTKFRMKPLTGEQFGELVSMLERGEPSFKVAALAFRFALLDAAPLDEGVKVGFSVHPRYGNIATTDFLDECGCGGEYGARLIQELGELAFERARDLSPKS